MVTLTGPWAGLVVAVVALILLLAPASRLYRGNQLVTRRTARSEPAPLWATVFFRLLGLLLLALAAALILPSL